MDDSLKQQMPPRALPEKNTREYICPPILPTTTGGEVTRIIGTVTACAVDPDLFDAEITRLRLD
jgi:hypothetical protein